MRPLRTRIRPLLALALLAATAFAAPALAQPRRVLITNDNGIGDPKIAALARAFAAAGTEVWVVASAEDRSGASNWLQATRAGRFRVRPVDFGAGIRAFALEGTPGDCVVFALTGPLRGSLPELVVSGINGGANLADDWFGSGTIGAARTDAYFGVPAIAVSGLVSDDTADHRLAAEWVVKLAGGEAVRALRPPRYLTVSLPEIPPSEIRGVEVVRRARGFTRGVSAEAPPEGEWRVWALQVTPGGGEPPADTDLAAVARRNIAIVAMHVDEHDPELAAELGRLAASLPRWEAARAASGARPPSACRPGLGMEIDDAEDERGREWGVLVERVMEGGGAARAGLRPGDVIVSLNGRPLASAAGGEDPDDRFARLAAELACAGPLRLVVHRGGERLEVEVPTAETP
jgi:5'-nucleotidase